MKKEERIQKQKEALKLYLVGTPMYKISTILKMDNKTVYAWEDKFEWKEKLQDAHNRLSDKVIDKQEKIIEEQISITFKANKELLIRLDKQEETRNNIEKMRPRMIKLINEIKSEQFKGNIENRILKDELQNLLVIFKILQSELIQDKDLISIEKHGLDIIRPKSIVQNNFMKKETNISFNVPDMLKSIRAGEGM